VRDSSWTDERLRAEHGDGWMNANADALRYPGFRRIRTGSGVLVDDEGYVLTDDHLVRDDDRALAPLVEVELHDQTRIVLCRHRRGTDARPGSAANRQQHTAGASGARARRQ
jgi:hypothetical protein